MNRLSQWGGIAFMLGSALFLINKLNEMSIHFLGRWMSDVITGRDVALVIIGQVAYLIGWVALFRTYTPRAGRFAKIALGMVCGGGAVVALGHVGTLIAEVMFIGLIVGLLVMVPGLILFGVANLRTPGIQRWRWLPLFTGLMGFIGFFLFSGEQITATFLVFRTLFALGLFFMGLTLSLERTTQPQPAATPTVSASPAGASLETEHG